MVARRALSRERLLVGGGGCGGFVGDEAAGFVGTVAEGAFGGLTAAAEGDGGLVGGDFELSAAGVDQREGAFDDERAMGAKTDGDVGHDGGSLRHGDRGINS